MDLRKLKKLIDLVEESGITELEVTEGEERVRIAKQPLAPAQQNYMMAPAAPVAATAVAAPAAKVDDDLPEGQVVKSPMVGTFYRSASPESKAYVEVGQNVKAGETVCIIEAMKLMNEIKSEVKGKIVDIQVDNAEPVEFGQVLFIVEPS